MPATRVSFEAPLWRWQSRPDLWTFVSVPEHLSDEILDRAAGRTHGFGSVRVEVTVGATVWRTSIFPGDSGYSLPIKRAVREAEELSFGGPVEVSSLELELEHADAPGGSDRRAPTVERALGRVASALPLLHTLVGGRRRP